MRVIAAFIGVGIGLAGSASNASAQALPSLPRLYAGVEAGSGNRHADDSPAERLIDGSRSERGLDYGAFVGVELPSPPLLFFGAEFGVGRSEGDPDATWFRGIELPQQVLVGVTERVRIKPRWNYTATARVGVSPFPGLGVYGLAGYGGERVEVTTEPVSPTDETAIVEERETRDGIVYGAGVRYRFGLWGARLEYRRRETDGDYDPEQIMGGLFVAF